MLVSIIFAESLLRSAEAGPMTLSKAFEILEAEGNFYELGAGLGIYLYHFFTGATWCSTAMLPL